ncbi:LPS export ABC transporter permease LptG [soil metagenome]|nr:LptF/LptG family permease [Gemmatimonadota bacterium]
MMKLLDRYISRQFVITFLSLVLGLPLLFIITDLTDNLDKHLGRGLELGPVALSYLYIIPQYILWAIPIAALVATVFTIGGLTRHQEIAAAKAGGISFYRLIAPILILSFIISLGALGLGELVPVTNHLRAELLGERQNRSGSLRTNFVFQTEGGRVLSVRRLDSTGNEMTGVVVEQGGDGTRPSLHQTAERALWTEDGWRLEQGYLRLIGNGGEETTIRFAGTRIPTLSETPEELLAEPKDPAEMRYHEITRSIRAIERSGGDARSMKVEQAQKISLPLAVLVIVLFGAPLATSSQRGGTAFGVGVSLAVTMVYLLLFRIGKAVGASGAMDPIVAAWLPNLLFLAAGLVLLSRVRT